MRNGEASCAFKSESNVPTFRGKGSFESSIPAFRGSYPDPVFSNDSGFGSGSYDKILCREYYKSWLGPSREACKWQKFIFENCHKISYNTRNPDQRSVFFLGSGSGLEKTWIRFFLRGCIRIWHISNRIRNIACLLRKEEVYGTSKSNG